MVKDAEERKEILNSISLPFDKDEQFYETTDGWLTTRNNKAKSTYIVYDMKETGSAKGVNYKNV